MSFRLDNEEKLKSMLKDMLLTHLFIGTGFVSKNKRYFIRLEKEGRSFKSFSIYQLIGTETIAKNPRKKG